ncbi:alpha/beta-hydrolase [Glonium stellatum]|uniref:Carboxylic ester hydrolase n=1 Tax=Glonium stellatum TaxID=574774 RepID=A0A8E2JST7_9PEZI|nr:alpha/beta-hydrolase [Glonium stellatum]
MLAELRLNTTGPIVDLGYARYEGVHNESVEYVTCPQADIMFLKRRPSINTWFGIRYAQPPTGELRWRAPRDIELNNSYSRTETISASAQGPICVQGTPQWRVAGNSMTPFRPIGTEDCLLLDVLAPAHPISSSLPVMVQIHGGGYTQGNSEYYAGYSLVNQSRGALVYVTIQYRLSAYGFLSSEEIKRSGTANAGLLDQRAALMWVQRHISKFGGDPNKVTVYGGSAGGGSVTAQMIMYGGVSSPPFRAAVAEYPWWQSYSNDSLLELQYSGLLSAANCTSLTCLRSLPEDTLATASQTTYTNAYVSGLYGYGNFYYGPSVDGDIIRDLPSNEFKQGHFTKVPLLLDRDGYEGYAFTNKSENITAEETADLQTLFPFAQQSFFSRLYELYPKEAFNSTFFQRQTWFGDFIINCPTYYMASALSDWGLPVWKLIFNAGSQQHGATHSIIFDITYGCKSIILITKTSAGQNRTLASITKDWMLSFTTHLDPNAVAYSGVEKPYWPKYQAAGTSNFSVIDVNYTQIGVVGDFDVSAQCDFWHAMSYIVRN